MQLSRVGSVGGKGGGQLGVLVRQLGDLIVEVKEATGGGGLPVVLQQFPVLRAVHKEKLLLRESDRSGLFSPDVEFCKDALRMFAMAGATYAKRKLNFEETSTQAKRIMAGRVAARAGIESEDVLKVSLGDDLPRSVPKHYVALDHKTESLIVAVRGTKSIQDVYTTLVCKPSPFYGGSAHQGIALSATSLLDHLRAFIDEVLPDGYDIRMVGHSLGGGVAALSALQLLLDRKNFTKKSKPRISCWALAPPPVFHSVKDLPIKVKNSINCFVNRDDVVPTLSLAKVAKVINFTHNLYPVNWKDKIRLFLSTPNDYLLDGKSIQSLEGEGELFEDLDIPGRIYWMWGKNDFRLATPTQLGDLVISDTMILSHMVGAYERTMRQVIEGPLTILVQSISPPILSPH